MLALGLGLGLGLGFGLASALSLLFGFGFGFSFGSLASALALWLQLWLFGFNFGLGSTLAWAQLGLFCPRPSGTNLSRHFTLSLASTYTLPKTRAAAASTCRTTAGLATGGAQAAPDGRCMLRQSLPTSAFPRKCFTPPSPPLADMPLPHPFLQSVLTVTGQPSEVFTAFYTICNSLQRVCADGQGRPPSHAAVVVACDSFLATMLTPEPRDRGRGARAADATPLHPQVASGRHYWQAGCNHPAAEGGARAHLPCIYAPPRVFTASVRRRVCFLTTPCAAPCSHAHLVGHRTAMSIYAWPTPVCPCRLSANA